MDSKMRTKNNNAATGSWEEVLPTTQSYHPFETYKKYCVNPSFVGYLKDISRQSILSDTTKRDQRDNIRRRKFDFLMQRATTKYYDSLSKALIKKAREVKTGTRVAKVYFNFCYEDFKANVSGMGKPSKILEDWIKEMTNPKSIYLDGRPDFEGLQYDIWNNRSFTVVFSWNI